MKNLLIFLLIFLLIIILCLITYIFKHKCNTYVSPFHSLYIKKSSVGGKGVFASRYIKKGEILEYSPYIKEKMANISGIFVDYVFGRSNDDDDEFAFLAFGYCSMYNHADDPSAIWEIKKDGIKIRAIKNIDKDDEIFISYGPEYWDGRPELKKNKIY